MTKFVQENLRSVKDLYTEVEKLIPLLIDKAMEFEDFGDRETAKIILDQAKLLSKIATQLVSIITRRSL